MTESLRGLRLSRFYNYEGIQYITAPTGGWNPDANPWELPENQAPILDNVLIRPGKVVMRGPMTGLLTLASPWDGVGYVGGNAPASSSTPAGWLMMSRKTFSATARIDPWNVVLTGATAAKLAAGNTTLTQLAIDGLTTTTVAVTADKIPGPRWINFDGLLYGIAYDSTLANVTDTNANYTCKQTALLTLPYTGTAAVAPTVLANAPHGAFDLKGYLSRIWLLGGVDTPGGLTVHEPVTLYYTIPGTSGVGTASADWKDPVSGLVNKIKLDNNTADYGVGLGLVPNAMIIFRRSSVWVLRGNTSTSFQLQLVSKEVGCVDARSIVETDHGIYFMSAKGLMLTDGTAVQDVSGTVSDLLKYVISLEQGNVVSTNYAGWVTCARTSQGQILVSIGIQASSPNDAYIPYFCGMYDPATNTWVRITSQLWKQSSAAITTYPLPGPLIWKQDAGQIFALTDSQLSVLENMTGISPDSFVLTIGLGRMYDRDATVAFPNAPIYPIPMFWRTKLYATIGTQQRKLSISKRYFLDYLCAGADTSQAGQLPAGGNGYTIVANNSAGAAYDAAVTVPSIANGAQLSTDPTSNPPALAIQRKSQDMTAEISDIWFDVSWTQAVGLSDARVSFAHAELYGIGLEFQHTSDAR